MALYVQKFGGTSLGTLARVNHVVEKILAIRERGHDVVVVVSAMGEATDRLFNEATALCQTPDARELDALLATGEQACAALVAIALNAKQCRARSYTGAQAGILTDAIHGKAHIVKMGLKPLMDDLANDCVPVVAGFQGIDEAGNITTIGRGGSDTTAVAIAYGLDADECQIYSDVDGVYASDPNIVPDAIRLERISYEEMLELSSLGSRILQPRAVKFASKYNVPLRVLATFEDGSGTRVVPSASDVEAPIVSGVACQRDEAQISVIGAPDAPGIAYQIVAPVSDAHIEVDMIVQNAAQDGRTDFSFTVHRSDYTKALELAQKAATSMGARDVIGNNKVGKISLVGVGIKSHAEIAKNMFSALAESRINMHMVATSEMKISVIVDESLLEKGVHEVNRAFGLYRKEKERALPA